MNLSKPEEKKNSFFKTMADLSKISNANRTRLFESKDFGNYTVHGRSFSLYDPVNQIYKTEDTVCMDPKPGRP